jgi:hypothetical protein
LNAPETATRAAYRPIFGQAHDECFAVGFRARSGLVLRSMPIWAMTAQEVVDALFICKIAAQEAEADSEAGLRSDAPAQLERLLIALYLVLGELHAHWPGG